MKKTLMRVIVLNQILCGFSYAQLPNLVVPSGSFSPTAIARGGLLTITATVQNTGTANSGSTHLAFYLSTTTTISNGDWIGCVSVEPLAAGSTSEQKQIIVPVPASLTPGNYYVGWTVDPYNEVKESDESNTFYLPNSQLTITNNLIFSRHIPYPLIFVHGLNSSDQTWSTLLSQLANYGWSFGGKMDFCLNEDDNLTTSLLTTDIRDFTSRDTLNLGDYYTVNFDVNPNGSVYNDTVESNQSAIVKQGKAIQSAIRHVLKETGSEKVVLVGHSMGGLAAREYLQNSSNWQADGKHHVAKLLTIGTPHGGSNQWTFGIIDGYSEAVRDLRYSYSNGDSGVYLFGGNENDLAGIGFHNLDVNCNGFVGNNIVGLDRKNLPSDLVYTCVIGTGGLTGDGVVGAWEANLNNYYNISADTFLVDAIHTDEPEQVSTIMKGLDEPTYFNQSYAVGLDSLYYGLITVQSGANSFTDDYDDYDIHLAATGSLNIDLSNIEVPQLSVAIFDASYSRRSITFSNAKSRIDTSVSLVAGDYYFEVEAQPDNNSWLFPYAFKLQFTPTTGIRNSTKYISANFNLDQNYPDPFNPTTTISFSLPVNGFLSLKIYDVLGREVSTLVSEVLPAGSHSVQWNATNFPTGVYFYRLQAGTYSNTKKLLLLK